MPYERLRDWKENPRDPIRDFICTNTWRNRIDFIQDLSIVKTLLKVHGNIDVETFDLDLDKAGSFIVHSEQKETPPFLFSGIAFTNSSIIIGNKGLSEYLKKCELDLSQFEDGRFSLFCKVGDKYIAKTDGSGQGMFFYFIGPESWAISNSFFRLAKHLSDNKNNLNAYDIAIYLSTVHHTFFQQLISNQTSITGIQVLAADEYIEILPYNKSIKIKKEGNINKTEPLRRDEYKNALLNFSIKWSSIFRTILSDERALHGIDITGGVDSRTVLSLILNSGVDVASLSFQSNKSWEKDYNVATMIAKEYGFVIKNVPGPRSDTSGTNAYFMWKYGNLGIYRPFYRPLCKSPRAYFHCFGGGGESLRDFYGKNVEGIFDLINNLRPLSFEQRDMAIMEVKNSFAGMDIDIEHPDAMMFHYRNFRSRFHFGRNWFRELNGHLLSPLTSSKLFRTPFLLSPVQRKQGQVLCDIILLNNPRLLDIPFDSPKKKFSQELITSSPFYRDNIDINRHLIDMNIYGDVEFCPSQKQIGDDGRKMDELIIEDVKQNIQESTIFSFSDAYANQAIEKVKQGSRLTMDAMDAVALITAGEIAKITDT